jgi:signal transduction histidine kinase
MMAIPQRNKLSAMWHAWLTPKATGREEAFRERVLRATSVITVAISMINVAGLLLSPDHPDNRALFWVAYCVLGICAWILIVRRHITATAVLISVLALTALGVSQTRQGYWSAYVYAGMGIILVTNALIGTRRLTILFATLMVLEYSAIAIWQDQADKPYANPLPVSSALGSPEMGIVVAVTFVGTILSLGLYLVNELTERANTVEQMVVSLEEEVAARTRELASAKEEAEAARDRALQADKVKSQFLASMSHELRTPLNAVLTFNELIAMGVLGPVNDEQKDYLQKSVQSGRHLLLLINDVLDITKIQAGMLKLFVEDGFEVAKEAGSVASSAEKMLGDKPVQLVLDIDPNIPDLRCDKRRIRQVLLNLLSNAIKFTEEGTITFCVKNRQSDTLFAVIDSGPGIAKDQQNLIFEPFVQTETGIRHVGGTGLGLAISKQIVNAHHGHLWVESSPGEGAAFFVTLPNPSELAPDEKESRHV